MRLRNNIAPLHLTGATVLLIYLLVIWSASTAKGEPQVDRPTSVDDTSSAAATTSTDASSTSSSAEAPPHDHSQHATTLVRSTVDEKTGLRTDIFLKPLGSVLPGHVIFTRPESDAGRLERPSPGERLRIAHLRFEIIDADTNETIPLDELYNHHFVIYSGRQGSPEQESASSGAVAAVDDNGGEMKLMNVEVNATGEEELAAARTWKGRDLNRSLVLSPCSSSGMAEHLSIHVIWTYKVP